MLNSLLKKWIDGSANPYLIIVWILLGGFMFFLSGSEFGENFPHWKQILFSGCLAFLFAIVGILTIKKQLKK